MARRDRHPEPSARRRRWLLPVVAVLACLLSAAGSWSLCRWRQEALALQLDDLLAEPDATAVSAPWFREVAALAHLDFRHVSGLVTRMWFPEIMCGGAGFLDYDGDGHLDLYMVQGGDLDPDTPDRPGNQLYRNRGDGTFENVTEEAGVGDVGYGNGCACGDYDGDGDVDLFVTNTGPDVLYRNNGDGTFTDVTATAGVGDPGWSTSAAFLDYDQDGDLDLFVVQYVRWSIQSDRHCFDGYGVRNYCSPMAYAAPTPDILYRNRGDGTFENVTHRMGIDQCLGNGLGVICADLDRNGWLDIYVANDAMPNKLWLNFDGVRLEERALEMGCSLNMHGSSEAGMGVVAFDAENDGDLDLFITHLVNESNTCYVYRNGGFDDRTASEGLSAPSIRFTGFGTGMTDLDHDGVVDLYVANGQVGIDQPNTGKGVDPYAEPNQLYRGLPGGGFQEVFPRGGTAELLVHTSRAAVFGDYDNDGDIDLVVVNRDAAPYLLENVVAAPGRWIMFELRNRRGQEATGALVGIQVTGSWQWRVMQRAYGYQTSNDPRVHFGLGAAGTVENVVVRWPGGVEESFGPREAGLLHRLQEGRGQPR